MKRPYFSFLAPFITLILIFVAACDSGTSEEPSIINNSRQDYSFSLGNKTLTLVNNIYNDNNHIRIDGHDTVTVVKVRITKYGVGATEEIANNLLTSVQTARASTAFEEVVSFDSPAPNGAYTVTTVTMPRNASLKIVDKQGKHEIYNVDGRLDLNVWKGWMTVLSASQNVKSYMDYGDMLLNLQHCKETGFVDAQMEGDGAVTITVPRLVNSPTPTQANLRAENKEGGIELDGLTLLNRADSNVGTKGMLVTGGIDRGNGTYRVLVNKGTLKLRAWAGVTKN